LQAFYFCIPFVRIELLHFGSYVVLPHYYGFTTLFGLG
jgi:hypothetical protein